MGDIIFWSLVALSAVGGCVLLTKFIINQRADAAKSDPDHT